jgi:regulator of sigma E protease
MGIVSAIIILGVLIFVHELGHFLVAKWCGVGVLEFSIGFGPVIFKFQGGDTTYSLRAIPLGGFVRRGEKTKRLEGPLRLRGPKNN